MKIFARNTRKFSEAGKLTAFESISSGLCDHWNNRIRLDSTDGKWNSWNMNR